MAQNNPGVRLSGTLGGDRRGGGGASSPEPSPTRADSPAEVDRRSGLDRRAVAAELNEDGSDTGLERRRGPGRRRTDFNRAAEEGELTPEQFLFVKAIDAFKIANNKMYPTWTDVLEVVRLLGYRKTQPSQLNIRSAEDWTEAPDALSKVRSKPGHPEMRDAA